MVENPYQPPSDTQPQFYTDDVTSMPVTAIWRVSRRQGLIGCVILFPCLLVRKAFKLRYPANHGMSRVVTLSSLRDDELPIGVHDAFAPFEAVCRGHGMRHILSFRPPWIGGKSAVFSMWLDPSGEFYCNITQIDVRLGAFRQSSTIFACHSLLDSGAELHTSAMAPENWIPELIRPHQEMEALAPDAQPIEVIECHIKRIADRSGLIRFTNETLLEEIIRGSQEQFDFMVDKGIYTPLTVAEIQRLESVRRREV
jgi:hypothetical protein